MQDQKINAEKITKPIQLLAAWLIGLIVLVSALITAAATVKTPTWLPVFYSISAVAIIPVFLGLIFLLQTKYRPEMQEDVFYAKYLEKDTMTFKYVGKDEIKDLEIDKFKQEIISLSQNTKDELKKIQEIVKTTTNKPDQEREIAQIIEKSDDKLDQVKQIVKFASITLNINSKLPNYSQILSVIKKIGFSKYSEFGTNEIALKHFVLSFGEKISYDIYINLIYDLIPLGATHVRLTQQTIDDTTNTIFVGSYALDGNITPIDEHLINKLSNIKDSQKFGDFIKQFSS